MPANKSLVPDRTLHADFSWRKYSILIREAPEAEPIYLQKWNCITMKSVLRTGPSIQQAMLKETDNDSINSQVEDSDIIGTSRVRAVHIDVNATLRGRDIRVSADSRLQTRYKFVSHAYATDPLKPAVMTWKSNSAWKYLDFDLLDENENLVARFNPKYFALKSVATVEFFGPHAFDRAATEEVLITGLSMYLCMQYRVMSFLPLGGSIFGRSGKDFKVAEKQAQEEYERNLAMAEQSKAQSHLRPDGSAHDPEKLWGQVQESSWRQEDVPPPKY